MRFETKVMAALVMVPVVLTQTPASAYDLPYDPYPWCAHIRVMVVAARIVGSSPLSSAGKT
jgi:hypothetical protein